MGHDKAQPSGLLLAPYSGELQPLDPATEAGIRARMRSIPIFTSLGFSGERLGVGSFECTVARNKEFDGIFDSFHGGLLMTAADSAAAIVALTLWGAESRHHNYRHEHPFLSSGAQRRQTLRAGDQSRTNAGPGSC